MQATSDTTRHARSVQIAAWRRMSPQQRIELLLESSAVARELAADGIARRRPGSTDAERRLDLFHLCWGETIPRAAWAEIEARLPAGRPTEAETRIGTDP